ncbi:MAG: hypothetical protein ACI835_000663, partial [Planctomycetota bacterium]
AAFASSIAISLAASTSFAQLAPYSEDFEALVQSDPDALLTTGWLVFGNVFDSGGGYLYGYGPFGAPNGTPGFCAVSAGEGGAPQGAQGLVVYSDYNNGDHANGHTIEANTFQEQIIDASDVGKTFKFQFDAKLGDIMPASTAQAFIKVIDGTVFSLDGYVTMDTTAIPTLWGTYELSLTIDANHVGDFFQIGFSNMSTAYTPSGIHYDNVSLSEVSASLGTNYCTSDINSTGGASVMSATGSASIAAQNLTLSASSAPSQPGIFYYGPNQLNSPFGNGVRCIGGATTRLPVVFSGGGSFDFVVDFNAPGINFSPGTVNFQCWYRDPAAGGASYDLSDGYSIVMVP